MTPEEVFAQVAAEHPRCVWLDGGGARSWSGRRSLIGWLEPSDVSLTYRAATREVTRHADGRSEVVGDDVFDVLTRETASGGQWFGYLGYAARPDLPALVSADPGAMPDAVWLRPSHLRLFEHGGLDTPSPGGSGGSTTETPPGGSGGSTTERPPGGSGGSTTERPPGGSGGSTTERPPGGSGGSTTENRADRWSSRGTGGGADRWSSRASASEPVSRPPDAYCAAFDRVQEALHAGDTYEANLTYRLSVAADLDPAATYLRLRDINPAPYAGFLQHDVDGARAWLLSSSPERYALVGADRTLETRPIKGTTQRGETPEQDAASAERLRTDPKFRSENLMIVDLLRNDLSMVCEPGSVEVPELMAVESYASVHQLVSTVRGRLRDGVGTVEALRALFPAGSMTGAPKLRTMEIIAEAEAASAMGGPRGAYAGAFGWISADGPADLGVVIRTLTTTDRVTWTLGTGGGITVRSDVAEEYAESRWKAERLLRALAGWPAKS